MNRDDIRKLIQTNKPTQNSDIILRGVIVRTFDQLLELDEQLKGASITEKDLRQLMHENEALEQNIVNTNAAIVQAGKDADTVRKKSQSELESLRQKGLEMDKSIRALEAECEGIRQEIGSLAGKPSEMKRVKGKVEELQSENSALLAELGSLGEDYQEKADLHKRLAAFVEKIESLEKQMGDVMNDIWKDLKKDAFDRMNGI